MAKSKSDRKIIDLSTLKRERVTVKNTVYCLDHDNWEELYREDLANPDMDVLMISVSKGIQEETIKRIEGSIYDPSYNVPIDVDGGIVEYSCGCGSLTGRYNEGNVCPMPTCNTEVEVRHSVELLKRGWIDLSPYRVISPSMYVKLESLIGGKPLKEILYHEVQFDGSGNVTTELAVISKNPYAGIGMVEFEARFEEICEYFLSKRAKKIEYYEAIMLRRSAVFTDKILVMSPALRPSYGSSKNNTFIYADINPFYNSIITNSGFIKKGRRTKGKAVELLYDIQMDLMGIYKLAIDKIKGKQMLIRNGVVSGRLFFSSRMVIIAETKLSDIDATRMSYKGFIGLFELEIINCMNNGVGSTKFMNNMSAINESYMAKLKYSTKVDPDIMDIINTLVHNREDDGLFVVLNRNPSLDLGSLQTFRIAEVIPEAIFHIITVPHNSLSELTADFDGDVANVHSPKEACVIAAFREGFTPSKLIIDRSGGAFNHNMAPLKDEIAFIRSYSDGSFKPTKGKMVRLLELKEILVNLKTPYDYRNNFSDEDMDRFSALIELVDGDDHLLEALEGIEYDAKKFVPTTLSTLKEQDAKNAMLWDDDDEKAATPFNIDDLDGITFNVGVGGLSNVEGSDDDNVFAED